MAAKKGPRSKGGGGGFIERYCDGFGVKATSRAGLIIGDDVSSLRFCIIFGRDARVGSKRLRTEKVRYWDNGSFRTDNYTQHIRTQHTTKCSQCEELETNEARAAFFTLNEVPFVNTLHTYDVLGGPTMLHFFVKKTIIETVFGDLFFHPEELAGVTQERALSVFTNQGEDEAINDIEIGQDQHLPVIKLEQQFRLAVKLSALGSSFRCVARLLEVIREESGSEEYGNTSEAMVISTYARIVCLSPCKSCRRYWKKVWAFSIGLCCSTYRGRSYVDIRVRMYFDGKLRNYPLVELPIFERHTELIYKLFDAVFPDWKISMIGLSTDGDAKIAGSIRGVTTRLEHTLADGVLRAWSGLHQLDLVMQDVVESTFDEEFISKLAKLVGYLRRQLNSSARAGGECPEYCDVRWGSMLKVLKWLKPHRLKVQSDLIELGVAWTPEDSWWVLLHVMADVLEQAQVVFSGLQGLSMVLEEHILRLRKQVEVYCKMCPMLGPLNEHNLEQVDASSAVIGGSFLASYRAVRSFIDGYGRWFLFALDAMEKNSREKLAHSCADLFVHLADGKISKGIAERDSINDAAEETPPFCRTSSYAAICAPTS